MTQLESGCYVRIGEYSDTLLYSLEILNNDQSISINNINVTFNNVSLATSLSNYNITQTPSNLSFNSFVPHDRGI